MQEGIDFFWGGTGGSQWYGNTVDAAGSVQCGRHTKQTLALGKPSFCQRLA